MSGCWKRVVWRQRTAGPRGGGAGAGGGGGEADEGVVEVAELEALEPVDALGQGEDALDAAEQALGALGDEGLGLLAAEDLGGDGAGDPPLERAAEEVVEEGGGVAHRPWQQGPGVVLVDEIVEHPPGAGHRCSLRRLERVEQHPLGREVRDPGTVTTLREVAAELPGGQLERLAGVPGPGPRETKPAKQRATAEEGAVRGLRRAAPPIVIPPAPTCRGG